LKDYYMKEEERDAGEARDAKVEEGRLGYGNSARERDVL